MSPFFLALLARVGRRAPSPSGWPCATCRAYRARSGSALSAISVGVLIAVVICAVAVARYSNVYDYVGPNLASNSSPCGARQRPGPAHTARRSQRHRRPQSLAVPGGRRPRHRLRRRRHRRGGTRKTRARRSAEPQRIGPAVGRTDLRGDAGAAAGLRHQSVVDSVQRRRPQLAARTLGLGRAADLRRSSGKGGGRSVRPAARAAAGVPVREHEQCSPGSCLAHPVVQEESRLPMGTYVTQHGDHRECTAPAAPRRARTASGAGRPSRAARSRQPQLTSANSLAAAGDLSIESKNDAPTSPRSSTGRPSSASPSPSGSSP